MVIFGHLKDRTWVFSVHWWFQGLNHLVGSQWSLTQLVLEYPCPRRLSLQKLSIPPDFVTFLFYSLAMSFGCCHFVMHRVCIFFFSLCLFCMAVAFKGDGICRADKTLLLRILEFYVIPCRSWTGRHVPSKTPGWLFSGVLHCMFNSRLTTSKYLISNVR